MDEVRAKDKTYVDNRREVFERVWWVCVLEVIVAPSRLRLTRKAAAFARVLPTFSILVSEERKKKMGGDSQGRRDSIHAPSEKEEGP